MKDIVHAMICLHPEYGQPLRLDQSAYGRSIVNPQVAGILSPRSILRGNHQHQIAARSEDPSRFRQERAIIREVLKHMRHDNHIKSAIFKRKGETPSIPHAKIQRVHPTAPGFPLQPLYGAPGEFQAR